MIHSVSANQPTFHRVDLAPGLNVILADRTEASTSKDTRNGVGKTTFLQIIDFCLGSGAKEGEGLMIGPLRDWVFTVELTLSGNRVRVSRAVADPGRVTIEGTTAGWSEQPDSEGLFGGRFFKVERWRNFLGMELFGLPRTIDQLTYKPSFRSLISYFIRIGHDAYSSPFRHFRQQKTWDIQTNIAYLLGMNWEYASRWQTFKDKDAGLQGMERAIANGTVEGVASGVGELETRRIQLEQQVQLDRLALESFKVHPQYQSLQKRADQLTSEIHDLVNRNIIDQRLLSQCRDSVRQEVAPSAKALELLYEEVGVVFRPESRRTLVDARTFHEQVVSNRRAFLQAEIERLQHGIKANEAVIQRLSNERAELLDVLHTHGALQEMARLQERFVSLKGSLDRVRARLGEIRNVKASRRELSAARRELFELAERDHEERRPLWSDAVRLFNEHSLALYRSPGTLIIDIDDSGYKYSVDIERSGSEGVDKMKIFCLDLALLQMQKRLGHGVMTLIHDTLMYDSVDARQRALALERAADVTEAIGAQYICTINSDMVPVQDFAAGFDFAKYVRHTLSDATPSGRLLGIQFERPRERKSSRKRRESTTLE